MTAQYRTGIGFDVHPFSDDPSRTLVLGGVVFHGEAGLVGHSDADVVCHAVADALLGAAGLGDLGEHFPDNDPSLVGADSIGILRSVTDWVESAGWRCANADLTVVAERPKIGPMRAAMTARIEEILDAPVNVKATRAEGLGAIGRAEGIACWSTVLLVSLSSPGSSRSF